MKKLLLGFVAVALFAGTVSATETISNPRAAILSSQPFRFAPKAEEQIATLGSAETYAATLPGAKVEATRQQLATSDATGYLSSPEGHVWFYTMDYDATTIEHEYFTETVINGYSISVYDENFNEIGKIEDTIELLEGETRTVQIQVGTHVTKKFFNYDNEYEVMVSIVCNTTNYTNNIRTLVYGIGNNEPLLTIPGYYVSAINTATDSYSENFWITFITEEETETPMVGTAANVVDYVFRTYKKAGYSGLEEPIHTSRVPLLCVSGENAVPFLSTKYEGKPWFAINRLKYCWFEEPYNYENENPTPDNALLIDIYTIESNYDKTLSHYSQTSIPSEATLDNRYFLYHGSFSYDDDLSLGTYSTDGHPSLIITEEKLVSADNFIYDYDVYSAAPKVAEGEEVSAVPGTYLFNIATDANSGYFLSDVPGYDPQVLIVKHTSDDDANFEFINLLTGKLEHTIGVSLPGGYNMTTEIDRVASPDGYLYAVAQLTGNTADNGDVFTNVVYVKPDGSIDHVDKINLGPNVEYGLVYVGTDAFNPYIFNLDNEREYMALVKRRENAISSKVREELVIVREGEEYSPLFILGPDDELGALMSISLINTDTLDPRLAVFYRNNTSKVTLTTYALPFDLFEEGDGSVENPYIISSVGGLKQMAKFPTSHFAIGNDFDASAYTLKTNNELTFTGSLDGRNHTISNLTIEGAALFAILQGEDADDTTAETSETVGKTKGVVRDITFVNPVLNATSDDQGLIAGMTLYATISGIKIYGGQFNYEGNIAGIAGRLALNSIVESCYVNADILSAGEAGGIVVTSMTSSTVRACAFKGTIESSSYNVGGIAANLSSNSGPVENCHVNAIIKGANTIGGIVGSNSRANVKNCHVQGTLEATSAGRWGGGPKVGGIIGELTTDYQAGQAGYVSPIIISGNYANLTSLTYSGTSIDEDYTGQNDSMHRIIGYSSANDENGVVEAGLANNYAATNFAIINSAIANDATSTEGKTLEDGQAGTNFFTELGWAYGYSSEEPWSYTGDTANPSLYIETSLLLANKTTINIDVDASETIVLSLAGEEITEELFANFSFTCTDETVVELGNMQLDNGSVLVTLNGRAAGNATMTFNIGNSSTTVEISVVENSGVENIATEHTLIRVEGRTITAPGQTINVYTLSGTLIATGYESLFLAEAPAGIYVVRANSTAKKVVLQ